MEKNDRTDKNSGHCLVVIAGPTGVGKTRVCADLAPVFGAPVISADSRQMYREMKIGTAVPSPHELAKVEHYFIGNISIHEYYNASIFETEALDLLDNLFKKGKLVFMAGGSGLYIDAVCRGIDYLPPVDPDLRKDLALKYRTKGIAWLRQKLKRLDPLHYEVVDLRNPNRMLKAIEVSLMTGKPYSSYMKQVKKERTFNIVKIGLNCARETLYEAINNRVDNMFEQGLVEEAAGLFPYRQLNALNTVGYKELFAYMDGKYTLDKARELIKRNSRHYAKRQLTWLTRDREIKWFHPSDQTAMIEFIEKQTGLRAG
jgi:tRNA dimethylallyltransferase